MEVKETACSFLLALSVEKTHTHTRTHSLGPQKTQLTHRNDESIKRKEEKKWKTIQITLESSIIYLCVSVRLVKQTICSTDLFPPQTSLDCGAQVKGKRRTREEKEEKRRRGEKGEKRRWGGEEENQRWGEEEKKRKRGGGEEEKKKRTEEEKRRRSRVHMHAAEENHKPSFLLCSTQAQMNGAFVWRPAVCLEAEGPCDWGE